MKRSPLDRLIAAEREAPPQPSRARARASFDRLEKSLAAGAAAPFDLPPAAVAPAPTGAAATGGLAKVAIATALLGGGAVAAVGVLSYEEPTASEPIARTSREAEANESQASAEPVGLEPTPAPTPERAETGAIEDAPRVDADHATTTPPRTSKRAAPRVRSLKPSAASPAPAGIGRELELVKQAGGALKRGDHRGALEILDTHASEFPQGTLTEDREALRAIASCGLDPEGSAEAAAASFSRRFPRSVHADRVHDACSGPKKVNP